MTALLTDEWRHARKRYWCDICGDPIRPRDLYHVTVVVDADGFGTCRLCPVCVDVECAFSRSPEAYWCDEGWGNEVVIDWAEDIALNEPDHPAYRLAARLSTKVRYGRDRLRADLLAGLGITP